jgi:hypothetical protein
MSDSLKDTGCKPQSHGKSDPGGGPCPRCRRPRCSAAAKTRPGERCRKNPHPGATICTNHGLTEAGRVAAAERRELEKARSLASTLGAPVESDPHTVLLEELYDAAGEVAWLGEVVRGLDKDEVSQESQRAGINVWVRLWHEARDRRLRAADRCINAGIEERRVRIAETAGAQLAAVVRAVLDRLGLTEEQRVLALSVVPEEFRRLGDVVPGEVVAS